MTYGARPSPLPAAPVLVAFSGPERQRRVTVLFRIILVIPQLLVVEFVGIAAIVVAGIGWFGAMFTGRLPTFAAEFLSGYVRWLTRILAYVYFMTDRYPPFALEDAVYPVRVTMQPGPLNRWAVFFRFVIVIPASVVETVALYGAGTVMLFITWLIVLFSGRMPPSVYQAYAAVLRYQTRVTGYLYMVTSEYPWGLFGDTDTGPASGAPPLGAYGAPHWQHPAPAWPAAPAPPPAPAWPAVPAPAASFAPRLPGVMFTFGGQSYLWGYPDDRSSCGIWSTADTGAPPRLWPIGEHDAAWARFRELEPYATALAQPPPSPPPAAPAPVTATGGSNEGVWAPVDGGWSAPPAGWSPVDDPTWRLVLSSGAKNLVVLFLVLGAVLGGVYIGVLAGVASRSSTIVEATAANIDIHAAYGTLNAAVNRYESETNACQDSSEPLSCGTGADRRVGRAFGSFVQSLNSVTEPSGARAAAAIVASDGSHTQHVFAQLAASTSFSQYQQILGATDLQQVVDQFVGDYDRLVRELNSLA